LATNTGRKGAAHDFGVNFPHIVRVDLLTRFGTAPTAGKTVDVWWASSVDNMNFDSALSAGDAAQNDFNIVYQTRFIGSLPVLANTAGQRKTWEFRVPARYGFPIVMNNAVGQSLSSSASHHVLTITPISITMQ